jgi:hypothetical protein
MSRPLHIRLAARVATVTALLLASVASTGLLPAAMAQTHV